MTDAELLSLFPEIHDLSVVTGLLPAVRDQKKRRVCLAHAVTTSHEVVASYPPLSVEYLQYHAWDLEGRSLRDESVTCPAIQTALDTPGQPLESEWPYDGLRKITASDRAPTVGTRYSRKSQFKRPFTLREIPPEIQRGNGPTLLLQLTPVWYDGEAFIGVRRNDFAIGYHAVTAVAFGTRSGQLQVIIQNSWGDSWGRNGYAALDESYSASFLKGVIVLN